MGKNSKMTKGKKADMAVGGALIAGAIASAATGGLALIPMGLATALGAAGKSMLYGRTKLFDEESDDKKKK